MKQKKGLEMAITTVIMIILSISVLTVLIVFFNSQTGFLSRFFKTHNSASNVDDVISACNSLVDREGFYTYCCETKEVKLSGDSAFEKFTCDDIKDKEWASGRVKTLSCVNTVCSG